MVPVGSFSFLGAVDFFGAGAGDFVATAVLAGEGLGTAERRAANLAGWAVTSATATAAEAIPPTMIVARIPERAILFGFLGARCCIGFLSLSGQATAIGKGMANPRNDSGTTVGWRRRTRAMGRPRWQAGWLDREKGER
ncbi:MAG: hypothetical protein ABIS86_13785 [Streptosporangiaceae bacterium]